MSYPINYPTPQGANVQIFNAVEDGTIRGSYQTWVKPQGANMVWFTLIGAGGGGGGTNGVDNYAGGGSGAVTNLMIPAFLVPDNLSVAVGLGGLGGASGGNTGSTGDITGILTYFDGFATYLLRANGGQGGGAGNANGGSAMTANYFTAAGFFQSIAGDIGVTTSGSASSTTFLSGGGSSGRQVAYYGYSNGSASSGEGGPGYFQLSPIIVGVGGDGLVNGGNAGQQKGGIGCGGGGGSNNSTNPFVGSPGGNGLAVIITW
jgi:hypothetical protein